jgi:hypothetical protein
MIPKSRIAAVNRWLSRAGRKAPINRTHSKRFALRPSQRSTRQRLECVRLQRRFPKAGCDSIAGQDKMEKCAAMN